MSFVSVKRPAPIRMEDSTIAARVGIHQEGPDHLGGTRIQLVNSQVITSRPSPTSQPGAAGTGAAIAVYKEDSTLDVQGGTLTCIDTIGADYRPVGADCHAISF